MQSTAAGIAHPALSQVKVESSESPANGHWMHIHQESARPSGTTVVRTEGDFAAILLRMEQHMAGMSASLARLQDNQEQIMENVSTIEESLDRCLLDNRAVLNNNDALLGDIHSLQDFVRKISSEQQANRSGAVGARARRTAGNNQDLSRQIQELRAQTRGLQVDAVETITGEVLVLKRDIERQIDKLVRLQTLHDDWARTRTMNSRVVGQTEPIRPLSTPAFAGEAATVLGPAPANFPQNKAAFMQLTYETITELLQAYDAPAIPYGGSLEDHRKALAYFIGLVY
ncbi:hypothetical protein P389DRAFT_207767 [Cystobasidium minutum MCA 4210]|uniref:uncharacterized protein n=1 Tax=Cystobasidium minutum MCA 4210 TaxID=1397322 RepID=UPI0034CD3D71|eukprot:jgi/Rhomi1/207767/estExt_Genemark1.C_1_t20224